MERYLINIKMLNEKQFRGEEPGYICETSEYIEEYAPRTAFEYFIQYFIDQSIQNGYSVERISNDEIKVKKDEIISYYRFQL